MNTQKKNSYNRAKVLIQSLKLKPENYAKWIGSTAEYWNNVVKRLERRNNKRNELFNELKQLSKYTPIKITKTLNPSDKPLSFWSNKLNQYVNKINLIQLSEQMGPQEALNFTVSYRDYLDNERIKNQVSSLFSDLVNKKDKYVIKATFKDSSKSTLYTTITQNNVSSIISNFDKYLSDSGSWARDSYGVVEYDPIDSFDGLYIDTLTTTHAINNRDGAFFPYINTTNIDLSKYQIYNQEQALDDEIVNNREHCLLHALKIYNIDEATINAIKTAYKENHSISKKDLRTIATIIGHDIHIHSYRSTGERLNNILIKYEAKNKKSNIIIQLALYLNHYFVYEEKTAYSGFSIKNYEEVKDKPDYHNIIERNGKYYKKSETKHKISSLLMIHTLHEQGLFKEFDMSKFHESSNIYKPNDKIYLDNIDNESQPFDVNKKTKQKKNIFYADCESFVNGDYHELYLLGVVSSKDDEVLILNALSNNEYDPKFIINKFLNKITNNGKEDAICYFHNLKYDYHVLEPFINIIDRCEKDGMYYSITLKFKSKQVELRDSYKLIAKSLSKFQETFNLPKEFNKKEAIAYKYYTKDNNNIRIKTSKYMKYLPTYEHEIFINEVQNCESYDKKTNTFNPTYYYSKYLKFDCLVLKKGLEAFNENIKTITREINPDNELSIFDFLTISSLSDYFMCINKAYEGVYENNANIRDYISRATYGGRVHVNEKYIKKTLTGKLVALDGVSLYPSAIQRLCREIGIPTGAPKRMTNTNNWNKYIYSIMTVKITKINKHQQMPMMTHKSEGITKYSNEVPKEPVIIDSITLEDYINFHQIEYEILDGIYWNDSTNKNMGHLINQLYQARLKYKKVDNDAMSETIKLMMNSAYGKTNMKKTNVKKLYKSNSKKVFENGKWITKITNEALNFNYNNFNTIKHYTPLDRNENGEEDILGKYEITQLCADYSYNRGHVACMILSMSKRIMNEIFNVANDLNIPIYYTDTDSMHLDQENVPVIVKEYNKRYNKQLEGDELEQFHPDLSIKKNKVKYVAYAIKSIFLGKKSYIDVLEAIDNQGNKVHHEHVRMKGITEAGLLHMKKKYGSLLNLYEDLSTGKTVKITLNPYDQETNSEKVMFEYKNRHVGTRQQEFTREVRF